MTHVWDMAASRCKLPEILETARDGDAIEIHIPWSHYWLAEEVAENLRSHLAGRRIDVRIRGFPREPKAAET